jgi:hypothetical protein
MYIVIKEVVRNVKGLQIFEFRKISGQFSEPIAM